MKNKNNLMVVSRPSGFEKTTPTLVNRPSPASPMVLQMLMQSIMALNQKVDNLAIRNSQPLEVGSNTTAPIEVQQVEVNPPASKQQLDRNRMREIFD